MIGRTTAHHVPHRAMDGTRSYRRSVTLALVFHVLDYAAEVALVGKVWRPRSVTLINRGGT